MVLLVILPFASNFLVRVYAWMIILGPFDLLFSRFAVIVGLVFVHLPFMILPLYTNLEKHDPVLLDAAQDLGANRWERFWRSPSRCRLPGIFSGAALVFIPVLGMFAIPEILGGRQRLACRQYDQGVIPRHERLAVRIDAVAHADACGAAGGSALDMVCARRTAACLAAACCSSCCLA